jgi:hypothetical protein
MPSDSYGSSYHSSASRYDAAHGGRSADVQHSSRDLSPPRSHAEQPRQGATAYSQHDHRSVSPLGSSRFEKPSLYTGSLRRSATVGEAHETLHYGKDGYYGSSKVTAILQGAGLSRSDAVRGRDNDRGFGVTGHSGGEEARRLADARSGADFSRGGYSSWERY